MCRSVPLSANSVTAGPTQLMNSNGDACVRVPRSTCGQHPLHTLSYLEMKQHVSMSFPSPGSRNHKENCLLLRKSYKSSTDHNEDEPGCRWDMCTVPRSTWRGSSRAAIAGVPSISRDGRLLLPFLVRLSASEVLSPFLVLLSPFIALLFFIQEASYAFLTQVPKELAPLWCKTGLWEVLLFSSSSWFHKNLRVRYMLWWQSILHYWFSKLLDVTGKSFVSFLHWPRRIVLMVFLLSWLIFACFPSVFWECIQIHVFLCRKARHFTTPWSKCDILIWAQPFSSDKAFSPWWRGGAAGGEQGAHAPKPGLFLLLKFGEHGDRFWLRTWPIGPTDD